MANSSFDKSGWGCLGVIVLVGLVICRQTTVVPRKKAEAQVQSMQAFEVRLNEYIPSADLSDISSSQRPYLNGRVITVSNHKVSEHNFNPAYFTTADPVFFELPEELRARTPEEVRTVIALKWASIEVGEYGRGIPAIQIVCSVIIVDQANRRIVENKYFRGSSPPSWTSTGTHVGDSPKPQVVRYLTELPRN